MQQKTLLRNMDIPCCWVLMKARHSCMQTTAVALLGGYFSLADGRLEPMKPLDGVMAEDVRRKPLLRQAACGHLQWRKQRFYLEKLT